MSLVSVLPGFALTCFLLALVPGQGVAMVLRQTLLGGPKAAVWSVTGNSTGLVIWGAMSALGLSLIFKTNPTAYAILKWSGVAFLAFLAVQTAWQLRKIEGKFDIEGEGSVTPGAAFRVGLFTNLTNVKAAVFAVAFLPAYVPTSMSLGAGVFILGCVWALVSMCWYLVMIFTVDKSSKFLANAKARKALTMASAVGLLLLALWLAVS